MSRIAGIDVGGTFTDLIVVDDESGEVRIAKVPTTVHNQAFGVLAALDAAGVDPGALEVASLMTPVPRGVGPMTIACLLQNAVLCARYQRGETLYPAA